MHADEGNYTCVVSNVYGEIRNTFRVETLSYLRHKPVLVESSPNQTVMVGMRAELSCRFKSDLSVATLWLRPPEDKTGFEEEFDRNDKDNFRTVRDSKGQAVNSETLSIASTSLDDSGTYFCVGKTNSGMTPGFLHLTVLDVDEAVTETPKNQTVRVGEDAVFGCRTHLDLHKHTSWVRLTEDNIEVVADGTEVYRINNATTDDAGVYACVVGTDVAHFQSVAYLEVVEDWADDGMISFAPRDSAASTTAKGLSAIAATVSVLAALFFFLFLYIFFKCRQEQDKKRQAIKVSQLHSSATL